MSSSDNLSADEIVARLRQAVVDGLNLAAERVRAAAVPLTPLEYGDLRSSLTVVPAGDDGTGELAAQVVTDSPYAVAQHETLWFHHDDGQAKFLETASVDAVDDVQAIQAAAVRDAFAG